MFVSDLDKTPAPPCRRVLVIEDDPDAAESLKDVLEMDGHLVALAPDGPAGVALARTYHPEVVLCDIGLPGGLDGFGVARAFRADPGLASTFLVALTGYSGVEDQQQARAAGFDQHLAKPPDLHALELLLRRASPRDASG